MSLEKYLKYKNKYISLKNMTGGEANPLPSKRLLEFYQSQLSNQVIQLRTHMDTLTPVNIKIVEISDNIKRLVKNLPDSLFNTQPSRNKYISLTNMTGGKHPELSNLNAQLSTAISKQDEIMRYISHTNSQITETNNEIKKIADKLEAPRAPPVVTSARVFTQKEQDIMQKEQDIMSELRMNEIYHTPESNPGHSPTTEWIENRDRLDRLKRMEQNATPPRSQKKESFKLSDRARVYYS